MADSLFRIVRRLYIIKIANKYSDNSKPLTAATAATGSVAMSKPDEVWGDNKEINTIINSATEIYYSDKGLLAKLANGKMVFIPKLPQ